MNELITRPLNTATVPTYSNIPSLRLEKESCDVNGPARRS